MGVWRDPKMEGFGQFPLGSQGFTSLGGSREGPRSRVPTPKWGSKSGPQIP